jgi:LPXTG-motif cell wall-anchored protein
MYWGENDTSATPGSSTPLQARFDRSLLPRGRSRTIVVDAKPSFLVAMVTMRVHIFYPDRTDAGTTEIVLTKRVLVVQPAALVILGILLIAAAIWYRRRRRKRRGQRPTRPSRRPPVEPTRKASRKRPAPSRRKRVPAHADAAARVDRLLERARANPKSSDSSGV